MEVEEVEDEDENEVHGDDFVNDDEGTMDEIFPDVEDTDDDISLPLPFTCEGDDVDDEEVEVRREGLIVLSLVLVEV